MSDLAHKLQQLIALGECPCKSHTWSHWDTVLSEAVEIIKRLPVTANGVVVVPGDEVFPIKDISYRWFVKDKICGEWKAEAYAGMQEWIDKPVSECYSTKEAAEDARKDGGS